MNTRTAERDFPAQKGVRKHSHQAKKKEYRQNEKTLFGLDDKPPTLSSEKERG
jgi:hypothetical protein